VPPAPVPGAVRYSTPRSKSWGKPAFTRTSTHFGPLYSLDEYIRLQTRYVLNSLVSHDYRGR
jgi:hypothetical protein